MATNPLLILRFTEDGESIEAAIGSGSHRETFTFEDTRFAELLFALRERRTPKQAKDLISQIFGLGASESRAVLTSLLSSKLVIPSVPVDGSILRWEQSGWRDALDFHLAVQDLQFSDDRNDYASWAAVMKTRVDCGEYPEDPGPAKVYANQHHKKVDKAQPSSRLATVQEVFSSTRPFRSYAAGAIDARTLEYVVRETYLPHSWHDSPFGKYFKRSSPSGGARHPIEAYLIVLDVNGLEPGLYHIDTAREVLVELRTADMRKALTTACFQKPGIEFASAAIVLTVRWLRHQYKYQYSRSYRMIMLDVGHLIQSHALIATSVGIQSFLGPSIDDEAVKDLLELSGDDEDPIYVIGMGLRLPDDSKGTFFPTHAA